MQRSHVLMLLVLLCNFVDKPNPHSLQLFICNCFPLMEKPERVQLGSVRKQVHPMKTVIAGSETSQHCQWPHTICHRIPSNVKE